MSKIKFLLKGLEDNPLVLHNSQGANPVNAYTKVIKPLTAKRSKTDSDLLEISRIEWESGLYTHKGRIAIPERVIDACLYKGAKKSKCGPKYQLAVRVVEPYCELFGYDGPLVEFEDSNKIPNPNLDKYYDDFSFSTMVKVNGSLIPRTRPIFTNWCMHVTLFYSENDIDERSILNIVQDAGKFAGLCERRPRWGSFDAEIVED